MQYITKIQFSDSEKKALGEAMIMYKAFLKEQLKDGIKAPYWAMLEAVKSIEEKGKLSGRLENLLDELEINN